MKNVPEHIYLNIGSDDANDFNDLTEVTWCVDSTSDSDIKYTRTHTRKWHNLIKNPKDLPDTRRKVLIQIKDGSRFILDIGRYGSGNMNMLDKIVHWERNHVYGKVVAWTEVVAFNKNQYE
jgi:hypothetical protein